MCIGERAEALELEVELWHCFDHLCGAACVCLARTAIDPAATDAELFCRSQIVEGALGHVEKFRLAMAEAFNL